MPTREALALLDELLDARADEPGGAGRARADRREARATLQRLNDSVATLEPLAAGWPPAPLEQYQALQAAAAAGDFATPQLTDARSCATCWRACRRSSRASPPCGRRPS